MTVPLSGFLFVYHLEEKYKIADFGETGMGLQVEMYTASFLDNVETWVHTRRFWFSVFET